MPKIRYWHKTRQGTPVNIQEKSSDILQNMNFSRCYRNRDKFIYGFDPNIIDIEVKECIYLLDVYAKNEKIDLSEKEKKLLSKLVERLKV